MNQTVTGENLTADSRFYTDKIGISLEHLEESYKNVERWCLGCRSHAETYTSFHPSTYFMLSDGKTCFLTWGKFLLFLSMKQETIVLQAGCICAVWLVDFLCKINKIDYKKKKNNRRHDSQVGNKDILTT